MDQCQFFNCSKPALFKLYFKDGNSSSDFCSFHLSYFEAEFFRKECSVAIITENLSIKEPAEFISEMHNDTISMCSEILHNFQLVMGNLHCLKQLAVNPNPKHISDYKRNQRFAIQHALDVLQILDKLYDTKTSSYQMKLYAKFIRQIAVDFLNDIHFYN